MSIRLNDIILDPPVFLAPLAGITDLPFRDLVAGFGADRLAVVWVGRDDNKPARLTGSSGALRVWTDLALSAPPASLPDLSARESRLASAEVHKPGKRGGCADDLLGGFIEKLLGSGCTEPSVENEIDPARGDR